MRIRFQPNDIVYHIVDGNVICSIVNVVFVNPKSRQVECTILTRSDTIVKPMNVCQWSLYKTYQQAEKALFAEKMGVQHEKEEDA